jgi:hypothetical protein
VTAPVLKIIHSYDEAKEIIKKLLNKSYKESTKRLEYQRELLI